MSRFYYCPYCGNTKLSELSPEEVKIKEPLELIFCEPCIKAVEFVPSKHESDYYYNKSNEKYGDDSHWYEFLLQEIKTNPLFNEKLYERAQNPKPVVNNVKPITNNAKPNINVPKCPTCGSTNIKKISTSSKVFGAAMFGLFSKTAHSQFECQNCHYKW